jgi:hypothetical protein
VPSRRGAGRSREQSASRRIAANNLDTARPFEITDGFDRLAAPYQLGAHNVSGNRRSMVTASSMRPICVLTGQIRRPAWRLGRLLRVEAEIDHRCQHLHIDLYLLSAPSAPRMHRNAPPFSTSGGFMCDAVRQ